MNELALKTLIVLGVIGLGFVGGWRVKGRMDQAAIASEHEATQKAIDSFHGAETKIAATLETKLASLKANQTVVEREIPTIVERTVYRNVCLDADGLRLIEAARSGQTNSAGPVAAMSSASGASGSDGR